MDGLRDYVLHITATALICAVILRLVHGGGAVKKIMQLLCGVVLACSIIQPIKQLEFRGLQDYVTNFREEAQQAANWGKNIALDALADSIIESTETYILEKANAMAVDLAVEVELSDDEFPVPVAIAITGEVAPYAKSVLSDTISRDLGIPREKQIWISQ